MTMELPLVLKHLSVFVAVMTLWKRKEMYTLRAVKQNTLGKHTECQVVIAIL